MSETDNKIQIIKVKCVKNNKVTLTFAQFVENPLKKNRGNGFLSSINASNEGMNKQSKRQAWVTGMPEDIKGVVPELATAIDAVVAGGFGTEQEVDVTPNLDLSLEVTEDFTPRYDGQSPKTLGKDGAVITSGGQAIYSHTNVVDGEARHTFLPMDGQVAEASPLQSASLSMGASQA